jgi:RimJ/RimL family protein N-acetyltransferase
MNTIMTLRLTLRPLREDDLIYLTAAINNPRVSRNLARIPWPYDLDDARAFHVHTMNLPPRSASYALVLKKDGPVIGMTGYETDGQESELGYWLAENHWGKGYMKEAAQAVVDHAFAVTRLDRLQSRCFLGNEASRRLLIAVGFRPAGVGNACAPVRRNMVVTQNFELTAREWGLLRPNLPRSKTIAI